MRVVIAKVGEVYFDGEAKSVTLPASEGEMTVLSGHMPLVTTLVAGTITLRENADATPKEFVIESGVLEIHKDGATVIL